MSPAEIALTLEMLEAAIQAEPALQSAIVAVFSKPDPTPADWDALRVKVVSKNYRDYVPATALPVSEAPPAVSGTDVIPEAAPETTVAAATLGHVSPMA